MTSKTAATWKRDLITCLSNFCFAGLTFCFAFSKNEKNYYQSHFTGKLCCAGGKNDKGSLCAVEFYNLSTNTWHPSSSLRTPRYSLALAVFNGSIYATGLHDLVRWIYFASVYLVE